MPGDRRILRYVVPDDEWHTVVRPRGPVVHVAARRPDVDVVEFWALDAADGLTIADDFRVFGTGQPLPPAEVEHVGTALALDGALVLHLMRRHG